MSEAHHDLAHELPEYKDKIHQMKMDNGHFARLSTDYHGVVKELHQIEIGAETPDDNYVETLKKKRLALKDELSEMLRKA